MSCMWEKGKGETREKEGPLTHFPHVLSGSRTESPRRTRPQRAPSPEEREESKSKI